MWKNYLERDNERIVEWNAKAKEVREREICSKAIVAKQRMFEDFWFKLITGKFSGKEFANKYAWEHHASRCSALKK
jgi:hypothetical protein